MDLCHGLLRRPSYVSNFAVVFISFSFGPEHFPKGMRAGADKQWEQPSPRTVQRPRAAGFCLRLQDVSAQDPGCTGWWGFRPHPPGRHLQVTVHPMCPPAWGQDGGSLCSWDAAGAGAFGDVGGAARRCLRTREERQHEPRTCQTASGEPLSFLSDTSQLACLTIHLPKCDRIFSCY